MSIRNTKCWHWFTPSFFSVYLVYNTCVSKFVYTYSDISSRTYGIYGVSVCTYFVFFFVFDDARRCVAEIEKTKWTLVYTHKHTCIHKNARGASERAIESAMEQREEMNKRIHSNMSNDSVTQLWVFEQASNCLATGKLEGRLQAILVHIIFAQYAKINVNITHTHLHQLYQSFSFLLPFKCPS